MASVRHSLWRQNPDTVNPVVSAPAISAGELVRSGAVSAAEDRLGEPPPATLSRGHAALIEAIYRLVYAMAILDRERMFDEGRGDEIEEIVEAARKAMTETINEGPV